MNLVIDSSALIAYLSGEPGGEVVNSLLLDDRNACYAHVVNLCEVAYDFVRTDGESQARTVISDLLTAGLAMREDMDYEFWFQASLYKAYLRRVSLADCFCLTLAQRIGAEILTADHHEFNAIADQGICPVRFIR